MTSDHPAIYHPRRAGRSSRAPRSGTPLNKPGESVLIAWETSFPLLTNRFFLYDLIKFFAWTFVVSTAFLAPIFALTGNLGGLPGVFPILGIILAAFFVLFILIVLIVFRNRYPIRYTLTDKALYWRDCSRAGRRASRLAVLLGALSGRPSLVGAGLLSRSQEAGNIPWKRVRRFKEHPKQRIVSVKNSWRVVIRLYCTADNYRTVVEVLRRSAPKAVASA